MLELKINMLDDNLGMIAKWVLVSLASHEDATASSVSAFVAEASLNPHPNLGMIWGVSHGVCLMSHRCLMCFCL